jgi:hypothetical protein
MALEPNPFFKPTPRTDDMRQMIDDIEQVEETPLARYHRKVEHNMLYGGLRAYQRAWRDTILGSSEPRESPIERMVRRDLHLSEPRPVMIISGLGAMGRSATLQAALERDAIRKVNILATPPAVVEMTAEVAESVTNRARDILKLTYIEYEKSLADSFAKLVMTDFDSIYSKFPDEAETPKPGRRLAPAEIQENRKRNRAPRKSR